MEQTDNFLDDFHWLMDVLQNIDVGLVVLDENYTIQLWNSFMQNHSASRPEAILGCNLFDTFPELPEDWFTRKAQSVFMLKNAAFTTWEQRPYLFKFENYRPVTGIAEFMYQNSTIIPLKNTRGEVKHICIIVYDVTEVAVNRLQIKKANEKLRHISRTDGLTGLLNRKTWEYDATKEFKCFERNPFKCSLIMFDIDHFKKINDGYGHPAGDEVIRQTAKTVLEQIREIDIAGRYGGEEFCIIMRNTDSDGASIVAERIRKAIEALDVCYEQHKIKFTISLGIADLTKNEKNLTQFIDNADKALYKAKQSGRNNTVIFQAS